MDLAAILQIVTTLAIFAIPAAIMAIVKNVRLESKVNEQARQIGELKAEVKTHVTAGEDVRKDLTTIKVLLLQLCKQANVEVNGLLD